MSTDDEQDIAIVVAELAVFLSVSLTTEVEREVIGAEVAMVIDKEVVTGKRSF